MTLLRALLFLAASVLLGIAAVNPKRASIACSAASLALLAYALPAIDEGL